MPRITDARRAANRAAIVGAARRCFARDGFHRTSMPDIAREAGIATGATYGYFAGKGELVAEVAGTAFLALFEPALASTGDPATPADLAVAAVTDPPDDEQLRCAIQAWSELLRDEHLAAQARAGFDDVRARLATALGGGPEADRTARVVMAVLHGFVLQRVAFGLDDDAAAAGFAEALRALLG